MWWKCLCLWRPRWYPSIFAACRCPVSISDSQNTWSREPPRLLNISSWLYACNGFSARTCWFLVVELFSVCPVIGWCSIIFSCMVKYSRLCHLTRFIPVAFLMPLHTTGSADAMHLHPTLPNSQSPCLPATSYTVISWAHHMSAKLKINISEMHPIADKTVSEFQWFTVANTARIYGTTRMGLEYVKIT